MCILIMTQFRPKKKIFILSMEPQSKECSQCKLSLPINNFYIDRSLFTKVAYRSKCKVCCKQNNNQRKNHSPDITVKVKKCSTCTKTKECSLFYVSKRHLDGYFKECIACVEVKRKNKGNNPRFKRTKEYMISYNKNRKLDPNFKLKYALRSNLHSHIRRIENGVKSERSLTYVGCSLNFLRSWFEFQFVQNMTWGNHGTVWHIDHINPCSSFDLTDEDMLYECYNWSNLRPIYSLENLSKGDKVDTNLLLEYEGIKEIFLGLIDYTVINDIYTIAALLPEVKTLPYLLNKELG